MARQASAATANTLCLPIEVSGWDAEKQFFVEKAELDWSETGRKTALLRHRIQHGALVFVRLLVSSGLGKDYPTPHQAVSIESSERAGFSKVRLVEFQPRRVDSSCTT